MNKKISITYILLITFFFTSLFIISCQIDLEQTTRQYIILFDSDGGSKINSQTVEENTFATEPKSPIKEGFSFDGWYIDSILFDFSQPITNNITLKAHWKPIIHIVSFDSNGGTFIEQQTVQYGQLAYKPVDPERENYSFNGWYIDETIFDFDKPIKSDITLKAKWKNSTIISTYTVQHYQQNLDNDDYSIIQNDTEFVTGVVGNLTTAKTKTYKGFTPQTVIQKTIEKDDKTIIQIYYNRNTITLTLITNGGCWSNKTESDMLLSEKYETIIDQSLIQKPTKEGYTFEGWYNDISLFDFTKPITNNITLKANWKPIIHIVSFDSNEGSVVTNQPVQYGQLANKPKDPIRENYSFDGWYVNETLFDFDTPIKSDITLKAKWKTSTIISIYTVQHYQQNLDNDDYTLIENDTEHMAGVVGNKTYAKAKSYKGFTPQSITQKTIEKDDQTIIRIYYTRNTITLSFYANGGTWSDGSINIKTLSGKYGADVPSQEFPSKTDYFTSWNKNIQKQFYTNESYTAQYKYSKTTYTVNHYQESLNDSNYMLYETESLTGTIGQLTSAVAKEYTGFSTVSFSQKIINENGNTVVDIYYARINIRIKFKVIGGIWKNSDTTENTSSDTITRIGKYGQKIDIPIPEKNAGCIDKYEWNKPIPNTFSVSETYIVRFYANYLVCHLQQNAEDDNYTLYETETLTGLVGQKTAATAKEYTGFITPIQNPNFMKTVSEDGDTIINIQYNRKLINFYFSANEGIWTDGTDPGKEKIIQGKYNETIKENMIPIPAKDDYVFDSWDKPLPTHFENDETYTAQWKEIPDIQYKVQHWQYKLSTDPQYGNGTTDLEKYYTLIESDTQTLYGKSNKTTNASPLTYDGFTVQNNWEQEIIKEDGSTVINICYSRNRITIVYNLYNTQYNITKSGYYGESVTPYSPPLRIGYEFISWNKPVQNIFEHDETYIAQWEPIECSITYKANEGNGEDIIQTFMGDQNPTLINNSFTRNNYGYEFKEWNTQSDGKGTTCTEGTTLSLSDFSTTNIILYAIWESLPVTSNNISSIILQPELYENDTTVIANYTFDGAKYDYQIYMTGRISDETLESINQVILEQQEVTFFLNMKNTTGITVLNEYSFRDSTAGGIRSIALKGLVIPDCIRIIKSGAFGASKQLTNIYLGSSLKEIEPNAFYSEGSRLSIVYFSNIDHWYSYTDSTHTQNETEINVTGNDPGEWQNARKLKNANGEWRDKYLYRKTN